MEGSRSMPNLRRFGELSGFNPAPTYCSRDSRTGASQGFRSDLILDITSTECEELQCPLCLNILRDCRSTKCGHLFCKRCLTNVFERQSEHQCPVCRTQVKDVFPAPYVDRKIGQLGCICVHADDGCTWTGVLKDLYRQDSRGHLSNDCLYASVRCRYCNDKFPRHEIADHEKSNCTAKLTSCPFRVYGCTAKVSLQDMTMHFERSWKHHLRLKLSYFERNAIPDGILLTGARMNVNMNGPYFRGKQTHNNRPMYSKGDMKIQWDISRSSWCIETEGVCIAQCTDDGAHPGSLVRHWEVWEGKELVAEQSIRIEHIDLTETAISNIDHLESEKFYHLNPHEEGEPHHPKLDENSSDYFLGMQMLRSLPKTQVTTAGSMLVGFGAGILVTYLWMKGKTKPVKAVLYNM